MTDAETTDKQIPLATAVALIVALLALAVAIIALVQHSTQHDQSMMSDMGMSHNMAHMQPLPIKGISDPPASTGGTQLRSVERGNVREFNLEAKPVWWTIYSGMRISAYAYNGIVPGPQIRVRNGQRVRVRFTNSLPEGTTVHWHGIAVPNSQDGVPDLTQQPIQPGRSFTYEFTAKPAGDPNGSGTFIYHSHLDEDRQMSAGLAGAFVIEPRSQQSTDQIDKTIVTSEWTVNSQTGRTRGAMEMEGMFPNFFTFNGKSFPSTETVNVPAGQRVRFRLINAGQFSHPLHLHGTAFEIAARDGHPTGDRSLRDVITLASGERADIVFKLPPGKWLFHCHIGHHLTNDGNSPGGLAMIVKAT